MHLLQQGLPRQHCLLPGQRLRHHRAELGHRLCRNREFPRRFTQVTARLTLSRPSTALQGLWRQRPADHRCLCHRLGCRRDHHRRQRLDHRLEHRRQLLRHHRRRRQLQREQEHWCHSDQRWRPEHGCPEHQQEHQLRASPDRRRRPRRHRRHHRCRCTLLNSLPTGRLCVWLHMAANIGEDGGPGRSRGRSRLGGGV